jgi:hypothetical protein
MRMGFLAWLRKVQQALHKCAESIRKSEERKKEQCLPSDKPVEVRAVISYDENTVTDAKSQATSEHATQKSIKKATWYAFVAVSVYAFITLLMWCQMIKQNRIADAALIISQRPWLTIEFCYRNRSRLGSGRVGANKAQNRQCLRTGR